MAAGNLFIAENFTSRVGQRDEMHNTVTGSTVKFRNYNLIQMIDYCFAE